MKLGGRVSAHEYGVSLRTVENAIKMDDVDDWFWDGGCQK